MRQPVAKFLDVKLLGCCFSDLNCLVPPSPAWVSAAELESCVLSGASGHPPSRDHPTLPSSSGPGANHPFDLVASPNFALMGSQLVYPGKLKCPYSFTVYKVSSLVCPCTGVQPGPRSLGLRCPLCGVALTPSRSETPVATWWRSLRLVASQGALDFSGPLLELHRR